MLLVIFFCLHVTKEKMTMKRSNSEQLPLSFSNNLLVVGIEAVETLEATLGNGREDEGVERNKAKKNSMNPSLAVTRRERYSQKKGKKKEKEEERGREEKKKEEKRRKKKKKGGRRRKKREKKKKGRKGERRRKKEKRIQT